MSTGTNKTSICSTAAVHASASAQATPSPNRNVILSASAATQPSSKIVLLHEILFTQDTISTTFSNGKPVDETVSALCKNWDSVIATMPPLRVVCWAGYIWSLDNRRLVAMKKASTTMGKNKYQGIKLKVQVVPFHDNPEVQTEFFKKRGTDALRQLQQRNTVWLPSESQRPPRTEGDRRH